MKNLISKIVSVVSSTALVLGMLGPITAYAAASITIDSINGNPPTGHCIAGPLTIVVHGTRGTNGGPYSVVAGNGFSTSTAVSADSGADGSFTNKTITYTPTGASNNLYINLFHGSQSGNDSHITVVNQCIAAPTQGAVIVKKHVVNDDGGTAVASNFTLHINGNNFSGSTGGTDFLLVAGTYPITEDVFSGYTKTSTICVGNNATTTNGSVTVVAGKNYVCTVINDDNVTPPVNNPPVIDPVAPIVGDELSNIPFDANATDPESDTLVYSTNGAPSGSSINPATGEFSWVPTEMQGPGIYNFDVCVDDSENPEVCTPVQITVNEVNVAPVVDNHIVATHMNMILPITLVGSDSDFPLQSLTFSIVTDVDSLKGVLQFLSGNNYQYVPVLDFVGSDSFTYKANDGLVDSNVGTITINVNNDAPLIDSIPATTTPELAPFSLTVNASDPNPEDTLTFSLGGTPPSGLTINPTTGEITWTPTEAQGPGVYPVTIVVSDGASQNETSFNINVTEVNVAPVASDGNESTDENTPVNITLTATDADIPAQILTYATSTDPTNGTLGTIVGNQVIYTPNAGFNGSDSFTFVANDGVTDSNVATVNITVSDLPACSDGLDNDQDGKVDFSGENPDPGCSSTEDNDETNSEVPPTPPTPPSPPSNPPPNDTGPNLSGGHRRDIGQALGASTGQVLGESCGLYMDRFVRSGVANNIEQVEKLQTFLNKWMAANLPVNGIYGPSSLNAVNNFQAKYANEILRPWGITAPTGIVYHTTLRWINMLECPELALAIPELVPWSSNRSLPQPALAKKPTLQGITLPTENNQNDDGDSSNDSDSNSNSSESQSAAATQSVTDGFWSKLKNKLFGN